MKQQRIVTIALVIALLASAVVSLLPEVTSAALPEASPYSSLQQPPPPPPPPPPPGDSSGGGAAAPGDSGQGGQNVSLPGQEPPRPAAAPTAAQSLPDPQVEPSARSAVGVDTFGIALGELEVLADRGCPSQYRLGDPIRFVGRRGMSQAAGYWLYMEIWNSTNKAWWTRLAADWVAPGGSLSRSGRIAEPVGQEQLYARLIDQSGRIVAEAWCDYTSGPTTSQATIWCGQTTSRSLVINTEDRWAFYGVGGQQVRINMTGPNGLDTYVELLAPNGSSIASNDDINAPFDLNSRLQVRLPSTGTYTIVARGFKRQAGQYNLSVVCP